MALIVFGLDAAFVLPLPLTATEARTRVSQAMVCSFYHLETVCVCVCICIFVFVCAFGTFGTVVHRESQSVPEDELRLLMNGVDIEDTTVFSCGECLPPLRVLLRLDGGKGGMKTAHVASTAPAHSFGEAQRERGGFMRKENIYMPLP